MVPDAELTHTTAPIDEDGEATEQRGQPFRLKVIGCARNTILAYSRTRKWHGTQRMPCTVLTPIEAQAFLEEDGKAPQPEEARITQIDEAIGASCDASILGAPSRHP